MAAAGSPRKAPPSVTALSAASASRGGGLTYTIYKRSNNVDPIKRAMARRPGWVEVPPEALKGDTAWGVNFIWKPTWTSLRPAAMTLARGHATASKRQVVNHWKAVEPLCTKDALFEVMAAHYGALGEDPTVHIPPTYLIEPRMGGDEAAWTGWGAFEAHFRRCATDPACANLWLIKPTCLNRGIGIEVMRDLGEIRAFLASKARGASMGIHTVWVLQKYIENLLLYRGRKFDLRVWVLVTDAGDVFMHAPGYVRTCSETFDLKATDRFAHLSNYCQQVNAASFGKYEEGNTLTFADLTQYLHDAVLPQLRLQRALDAAAAGGGGGAREGDTARGGGGAHDKPVHEAQTGCEAMWGCGSRGLWGQMRSAVVDTFEALRGRGGARTHGFEENGFARKPPPYIAVPKGGSSASTAPSAGADGASGSAALPDPPSSSTTPSPASGYPAHAGIGSSVSMGTRHRYELLGLDFMVDAHLKVHFIEVNTNPSLTYQNAWHEEFADEMIERMLDLVLDGVFPEPARPAPVLSTWDGSGDAAPPVGWQFVMNVYNASVKHAGQTGVPAASPAAAVTAAAPAEPTAAAPPSPLLGSSGTAPVMSPPRVQRLRPSASALAVKAEPTHRIPGPDSVRTIEVGSATLGFIKEPRMSVGRLRSGRLARAGGGVISSRQPLQLTVATLQPLNPQTPLGATSTATFVEGAGAVMLSDTLPLHPARRSASPLVPPSPLTSYAGGATYSASFVAPKTFSVRARSASMSPTSTPAAASRPPSARPRDGATFVGVVGDTISTAEAVVAGGSPRRGTAPKSAGPRRNGGGVPTTTVSRTMEGSPRSRTNSAAFTAPDTMAAHRRSRVSAAATPVDSQALLLPRAAVPRSSPRASPRGTHRVVVSTLLPSPMRPAGLPRFPGLRSTLVGVGEGGWGAADEA